jgi:glycosyltransferase involved in cell wall biosynthesis
MNVLIVTDEMELGGSQRQITELALGLRARGDTVSVRYFRNDSFLVGRLRDGGVDVARMPKSGRIDAGFVLRLRRYIRECGFEVVHAFSFTAELWSAVALALLEHAARPALVTSIRGTYEWYTPLQWRLKRWATRRSAAVVANATAGAAHAFARMRLPQERLAIVRNGIERPADREGARARHRHALGIADDMPLALFVGRLVDHKNLPMLVRAAGRLAARGSTLRFVLVGDGPLAGETRRAITDAGLDARVTLAGERDDAAELMCAADMLVLPSWREGLPNVVIEAMQAGCAVIATRAGGIPELIRDGETGLLVAIDDDAALAAALERLEHDPGLRARLAAAAQTRAAQDYGVEAMVAAMRVVYAHARHAPARDASIAPVADR